MSVETFEEIVTEEIVTEEIIKDIPNHVRTDFPSPKFDVNISQEEQIEAIQSHFSSIMEILGLDLSHDSLYRTPYRVAKMYVKEIFKGLDDKNFPKMTYMENENNESSDSVILIRDITVKSFCEHHFLPFQGTAQVAYIPNDKLIGLSKINRIVDFFSRRPQIQERLTAQIADSLKKVLNTEDIAVIISAQHSCVTMRGIEDESSSTTTSKFLGRFKDNGSCRQELFFQLKQNI